MSERIISLKSYGEKELKQVSVVLNIGVMSGNSIVTRTLTVSDLTEIIGIKHLELDWGLMTARIVSINGNVITMEVGNNFAGNSPNTNYYLTLIGYYI